MALKNYKPKYGKAPWTTLPTAKKVAVVAKPQRVRRRARRHAAVDARYLRESRAYIALCRSEGSRGRGYCPVIEAIPTLKDEHFALPVDQVHHKRGRLGPLLLDQRGWLAVSSVGHDWIHRNLEAAREHGFVCQRGDWGRPYGD